MIPDAVIKYASDPLSDACSQLWRDTGDAERIANRAVHVWYVLPSLPM
jgi:hypothetical protein